MGESITGWRLDPAKSRTGFRGTIDIDPIQKNHMEVNIEVEGTPEALDQGHCASLCGGFGKTGFADQVRGNGAINDAQYLAHDGGLTGQLKLQLEPIPMDNLVK